MAGEEAPDITVAPAAAPSVAAVAAMAAAAGDREVQMKLNHVLLGMLLGAGIAIALVSQRVSVAAEEPGFEQFIAAEPESFPDPAGRALVAAAKTLVVDVSMRNLNGIDAIPLLRKHDANVKIVMLTMHHDPAYARRGIGSRRVVLKHSAADELVLAINAALKGHTFITPALTSDVLREARNGSGTKEMAERSLTPRQREILQLLAAGHSAKEIAAGPRDFATHVEFTNIRLWNYIIYRATQGSSISQ